MFRRNSFRCKVTILVTKVEDRSFLGIEQVLSFLKKILYLRISYNKISIFVEFLYRNIWEHFTQRTDILKFVEQKFSSIELKIHFYIRWIVFDADICNKYWELF